MLDKLNVVFQRYNEVNDLIIQPDVISDSKRYVKLNREYKNLKPLVDAREKYLELSSRIEEAKTVLKEEKDPDFRDMAKMELDEIEPAFAELEEEIKILLIPKDPEDDKNALVMLQNTKANQVHYALKTPADFKAKVLENELSGLVLNLDDTEFYSRLIGRFNAYNLLAVYAVSTLLGEDKIHTLGVLSNLQSVEGRFQYLKVSGGPTTIIDYAHTPDALKNVLETIKAVKQTKSRLITVVGCGGDRDKDKRPIMATIASEMSEQLILTSDNPRTEDPYSILNDMKSGLDKEQLSNAFVMEDRKEAIKLAVKLANESDVILIAGKGHEKYQEINGVRYDFDDYKIASEFTNQMTQ